MAQLRESGGHRGPWRGIRRAAARLSAARGWNRILLALILGGVAVLALPPLYILPALLPAFCGLIWLIDGARNWRVALLTGYCFGLGYLTAGLYWVANALLMKPDEFGWLAPIAPVALAAILAPMPAAACALARLARRPGVGRVLVFAGAWTIMEWVRSWAYTGFPWNPVGSVWGISDAMLQGAALFGVYGLSLITVAAAAMPSILIRPCASAWRRWMPVAAAFLLLLAVGGFGIGRLATFGAVGTVDGVRLRLVQGNIAQNLKWQRGLADAHLLMQARLGATPATLPPTHILWSEAAAPLLLANDQERLRLIGQYTPPGGLTLLGTLRTTPPGEEPFQVWNSMLAIDHDGKVVDFYDKSHLVPFGEYMPLRSVLGIGSVAGGMTDFASGNGVRTLHLPGLPPVGPLICYEVIFSGAVVDSTERPQWLFNLTNDGWYGRSAGPYQHLVAARLRAVEEGLPVVRVANTGISAIIDPLGEVLAQLPLGERGVVDGPLPLPLASRTPYAATGPGAPLAAALLLMLIGALMRPANNPFEVNKLR